MWLDIVDRQKLVELAYQRGNELNLKNENYRVYAETFFENEYREDVGAGDITSNSVLTKNAPRSAFLVIKTDGVISGLEEVSWFLRKHELTVTVYTKDGSDVQKGETVLKLEGGQKDILTTERIALNVLQRMSGIATETKRLTCFLKDYNTRVAATRKTLLRYFDKKAVFSGGGLTHRFGLWDSVLIKDNHLEALKQEGLVDYIESAIVNASFFAGQVDFIELEVTGMEDAVKAARKFKELQLKTPCVVMLDNMKPSEIEQTLKTLRELGLYDDLLFEASGDITSENILEYAKTGIDVVSLGYLTHSVHVLDMSLEMTL
jgi:nicotinate-nucleotide pyrophosphorylase (carboxylating)